MTVSMGGKWNLRKEGGCEPSEKDPGPWSFFPGQGNHSREVNRGGRRVQKLGVTRNQLDCATTLPESVG